MTAPAGLPRSARLTRAADFAALGRDASAMGSRYFVVRYKNSPSGAARLAQAVSRRVHKRAVQRNRIKRQVRTAFRITRGHLPPLDLLIIARTTAVTVGSAELAADLAALFQRLDALKLPSPPGTMLG